MNNPASYEVGRAQAFERLASVRAMLRFMMKKPLFQGLSTIFTRARSSARMP
jgi:hypothetical protein